MRKRITLLQSLRIRTYQIARGVLRLILGSSLIFRLLPPRPNPGYPSR